MNTEEELTRVKNELKETQSCLDVAESTVKDLENKMTDLEEDRKHVTLQRFAYLQLCLMQKKTFI